MRLLRHSMVFLVLLGFVGQSAPLRACPLCKEAIASPGEGDEEINTLPQAYNTSIYLMVGVPYVLLCGVGFFIYRGCQKNAACLGGNQESGPGQQG